MPKQAISVTLDAENITWLKGRARGAGARSISDLLDRIISQARAAGRTGPARSVVGTIDIDAGDPLLERADAALSSMFAASLRRPVRGRETAPAPAGRSRRAKRGRG